MALKAKPASQSKTHQEHLIRPQHTNNRGTLFGGELMAWVDVAGATCAMRHCGEPVVTASMDAMHFLAPISIGWLATFDASVNFTSRTSCEVGVKVEAQHPVTGEQHHTGTAYLTFVALDDSGKPTEIPQVIPESADEKRRFNAAKERRAVRLKLKAKLAKTKS